MEPKFFRKPEDFRKWLEKNHDKKTELLVGFYKKSSGRPSIDWPQSVDVALSFGWIDGVRKGIDEESYTIRFTPRRAKSIWSAVNLKRMEELIRQGLVHAAGLKVYEARDPEKANRYSFEQKHVALDPAEEKKFKANKKAWKNFHELPPSYRRPALWWVVSSKKAETRIRRLETLIAHSEKGERIPPLVSRKPDYKKKKE